MYRQILVPLIRDDQPEPVLDHAAKLAQCSGAELLRLRVITVVPSDDYFFKQIQVEEGSRAHQARTSSEALLARITAELSTRGISARGEVVITDKTEVEAIIHSALEHGCDLIVLPNQTRAGKGRWWFNSLSEKVSRRSSLPVILV
jgi:nucleotide-binding universal stress UspA family protein